MHPTQAVCENAITYRAVKQLQRGQAPWGWNVQDLAQLTSEDPTKPSAGYDLDPERWRWLLVQLKGEPFEYFGGGLAWPNFKRGMAFNANLLGNEINFLMGREPSRVVPPQNDRLLAREWNKAFVCWPKLYPTALKLYAQGLYH